MNSCDSSDFDLGPQNSVILLKPQPIILKFLKAQISEKRPMNLPRNSKKNVPLISANTSKTLWGNNKCYIWILCAFLCRFCVTQMCDFSYPTGYVFPECVLISSTETNQTQQWEWRSSKPTVVSAVFLIVSVSECKGVISGLVKQPPGGCFKKKCLACDDCSAQLGLCCRFRSKFSDALKTAGEAGFLQILCRDLWVSLGCVCVYLGVYVLYVLVHVWTDSYNSPSLELVNKQEMATWWRR